MRLQTQEDWVTFEYDTDNTIVSFNPPLTTPASQYTIQLESYDDNSTLDPKTALKTDTVTVNVTPNPCALS